MWHQETEYYRRKKSVWKKYDKMINFICEFLYHFWIVTSQNLNKDEICVIILNN